MKRFNLLSVILIAGCICGQANVRFEETISFSSQGYQDQQEVWETGASGENFYVTFGRQLLPPKYFSSEGAVRVYGGEEFTIALRDNDNYIERIIFRLGANDQMVSMEDTIFGCTYYNVWYGRSGTDVREVTFFINGNRSWGHRSITSVAVTMVGRPSKIDGVNVDTPQPDPEPISKEVLTCAEAAELALAGNTDVRYIEGYVTNIATEWSPYRVTFWMADTENGGKVFEAYKAGCGSAAQAPGVGDIVRVFGKLSKHNTTPETALGASFLIIRRATPAVNLGKKSIAEFLELKNTKDTCVLTGIVANIEKDKNDNTIYNKYGNFDLVDQDDPNVKVFIYGLLTKGGEKAKFREMNIKEGDVITVKAVYKDFNGNAEAENAVLVNIQAAEAEVATLQAEPTHNSVVIEWPLVADAVEYKIVIKKGEEVICTLLFNADGHLLNISFAKPANDRNHSQSRMALHSASGWKYTISNLEAETTYNYIVTTKKTDNSEAVQSGLFTTKSTPTDIDAVVGAANQSVKIMRNGQVLILRDGKMYDFTGKKLTSDN